VRDPDHLAEFLLRAIEEHFDRIAAADNEAVGGPVDVGAQPVDGDGVAIVDGLWPVVV
jgi:hypothetical protein